MYHLGNKPDLETTTATFLNELRLSTSDQHLLLESNQLLSSLTSPDISLHHYYCYLFLMHRIHIAYEDLISDQISLLLPAWSNRKSSGIMAEDLIKINYIPDEVFIFKEYQLPGSTNLPGDLLGFMYVIEGSRLGGRVIYKNIRHVLGFSETTGAAFISDYGFETGPDWKNLLSQFSTYVVENDMEAHTIIGAKKAFASIFDFFELNRQLYEV